MTDLKALTRVEEASGPDSELDALILCALLAPAGSKVEKSAFNGAWCIYEPIKYRPHSPWRLWETPSPWRRMTGLTSSIDAALELVERKLPGKGWNLQGNTSLFYAVIAGNYGTARPTPALALLSALLKALIAQEETP